MAMPIMVVSSVRTHTPKRATNGTLPLRERTIVYEGSSGPRELLESIVIQANAAIKGLEGIKPIEAAPVEMTEEQKRITNDTKGKTKEVLVPPLSEENQRLLGFCQRILATAEAIDRSLRETKGEKFLERIRESLPKIHTADSTCNEVFVGAEASEEAIRQAYIAWATRVRFEYCDLMVPPVADKPVNQDEPPNYKFYYNTEARMLASSDIPKRSLAIAKEVFKLLTRIRLQQTRLSGRPACGTHDKPACCLGFVYIFTCRRDTSRYYQGSHHRSRRNTVSFGNLSVAQMLTSPIDIRTDGPYILTFLC